MARAIPVPRRVVRMRLHVLVRCLLVAFRYRHVVAARRSDRPRCPTPCVHRVRRHDPPLRRRHPQQRRHCRNPVRLVLHPHLSQHRMRPAAARRRRKADHQHPVRIPERRVAPTRVRNTFKCMSKPFHVGSPHKHRSAQHESINNPNTRHSLKCDCPGSRRLHMGHRQDRPGSVLPAPGNARAGRAFGCVREYAEADRRTEMQRPSDQPRCVRDSSHAGNSATMNNMPRTMNPS